MPKRVSKGCWTLSAEARKNISEGRKRYLATPAGKAQHLKTIALALAAPRKSRAQKKYSQRGRLLYPKMSIGTDWFKEEKKKQIEKQKGLCDLCRKPLPPELSICAYDHDHVTGECRAILHRRCNNMISYFEREPEMLRVVLRYLNRHRPMRRLSPVLEDQPAEFVE